LRTDQDSAIVYADNLDAEQLKQLERFSVRLVEGLEAIGVPRCPGNTMASNPYWRRSLSDWKSLLDEWIHTPKPENMVNFGMFQDLRCIHGDAGLEKALRDHIHAEVEHNAIFLAHMARNIVRFKPPLGFFGRIKVEQWGEHRDEIDLKKAGIFALTVGASLLAMEAGRSGGSTWEKLERLRGQGVVAPSDLETIEESFTYLVQLRLERQLRDLEAGRAPSNYLNPLILKESDRARLRAAFRGTATFLRILRDHFKLDYISR
jgi:CBS domain-containing protein